MSYEDVAIVDGPGYNGEDGEEPGPVAFTQDVPVNTESKQESKSQ